MSVTSDQPTYRYLNALESSDQAWPRFELDGLVASVDGITLQSLPSITGTLGPELEIEAASGITVGPDGRICVSDPVQHRVLHLDPCDASVGPLPCLSGPGWEPGQLDTPRGLLAGPRNALYIADSGNHRIVVVDLDTKQIRDIWGPLDPWSEPEPSTAPSRFTNPWSLAADSHHNIYVAGPGTQDQNGEWTDGQLHKLNLQGEPDLEFIANLDVPPVAPAALAISTTTSGERLFVLDLQPVRLLVYDLQGSLDDELTDHWEFVITQLSAPNAIAFIDGALFISDVDGIHVFDDSGLVTRLSDKPAVLTLDTDGKLLALPLHGGQIQILESDSVYRETGSFLAGPFDSDIGSVDWHELVADVDLHPGNHLQLSTAVTDSPTSPPGQWQAAPPDALQFLIAGDPGQYFWLAGQLSGDRQSTPRIQQIRVSHSHDGLIQHLPAIYQHDEPSRVFLNQMLALFEGFLANEEQLIDDLPLLFDAMAAPDTPDQAWLDWLSTWFDQPLDERWDDPTRRSTVAEAFKAHAQRGTVESLRQLIKLHTGVSAHISEPARNAIIWKLDSQQSVLGFSTRLAPAEADGAVLGSSAVLSQSHLLEDEDDFGAPLFDDLAHCFTVQVYSAEFAGTASLDSVRAVIDREKPAHTSYQLCTIGAEMRIGMQSRISIDTIIGPTKPNFQLGIDNDLGFDTWLAGSFADSRVGGTIGRNTVIGERTQLT